MCISTLKKGEIFFGIVKEDGSRSSIVKKQPTESELKTLAGKYPELFACTLECGHTSFLYSHIIKTSGTIVTRSTLHFICPDCGKRLTLGANYQKSQMRVNVINGLVD